MYLPYLRDPDTLARPWAIPGTPGLMHRVGGLEKADKTGNVDYTPANHALILQYLRSHDVSLRQPTLFRSAVLVKPCAFLVGPKPRIRALAVGIVLRQFSHSECQKRMSGIVPQKQILSAKGDRLWTT